MLQIRSKIANCQNFRLRRPGSSVILPLTLYAYMASTRLTELRKDQLLGTEFQPSPQKSKFAIIPSNIENGFVPLRAYAS